MTRETLASHFTDDPQFTSFHRSGKGLALRSISGSTIDLADYIVAAAPRMERDGMTPIKLDSQFEWIQCSTSYADIEPYPHVSLHSVLTDAAASALLNHLETTTAWVFRDKGLFVLSECDLLNSKLPASLEHLFAKEQMFALERDMTKLLSVPVQVVQVTAAHRLTEGQGLGIHSDGLTSGEDFRLALTLSRSSSIDDGGHFVLLSERRPETVSRIFARRHNSAVVIPLLRSSWHAVTSVATIPRYSVVFTFAYRYGSVASRCIARAFARAFEKEAARACSRDCSLHQAKNCLRPFS